jgi:PAS domain S-box-containing protein
MAVSLGETVLLVDDDANLLEGFRRRLSGRFSVRTFTNPLHALEAIRSEGPFPAVVSDMRMSEMDGLALLHQVRRYHPQTVGIILTGDGDQELAVQALNDGHVFRFLKKPCPNEELRQAIEDALQENRSRLCRSGFQYRLHQKNQATAEVEVGAGCFSVTGYSGLDFCDRPHRWNELVHPDDGPRVEAFHAEAWAGRTVEPIEYRLRRKDGTVAWVRNTLLSHHSGGSVCCLCLEGQIQDITRQKQTELELEQARRRYEKMVANVPGLVFQCLMRSDGEFKFEFVSHSCLELLGVTAEQISADSGLFFTAFAAEDRSCFYRKLADSAERLTPLVWQGCHTIGKTVRWFQGTARPERLADGCVLWDGLLVDITEQKQSERRAEFLAQFPKENPNPVLRVNEEGRIIYANDASSPLLERWDRQVGQLLPQDLYEMAVKARQSGAPLAHEVRCGDHYYAIFFTPVRVGTDVNLYARDVTEIKVAEIELRSANREMIEHDRLKSEFISTVTHELRTPLCIFRNILSNALAGVHGPISNRLKDNLEMAQQGVERLSRIIADFLDISKIESGSLQLNLCLCSMNELIFETCRSLKLLAAAKKIRIQTSLPDKHSFAWVDRDRIVQVLINLVGNAIKFIPLRGRITVALEETIDDITVRVQDDGPGLTKEEMGRIFDRFVQAKIVKGPGEHGTGLGLSISRGLVQMHGGTIGVESEVGKGCVFSFTIPRQPQAMGIQPTDSVARKS